MAESDHDDAIDQDITLAQDLVPDICDEVDLSEETTKRAIDLAWTHGGTQPDALNHTPSVVAASCVYMAGLLENEKRTQAAVGDAADVHPHSIRTCYHKIYEREGIATETGEVESVDGLFDEAGDEDSAGAGAQAADTGSAGTRLSLSELVRTNIGGLAGGVLATAIASATMLYVGPLETAAVEQFALAAETVQPLVEVSIIATIAMVVTALALQLFLRLWTDRNGGHA